MAKKKDSATGSLFGAEPAPPKAPAPAPAMVGGKVAEPEDAKEAPKLRAVPPPVSVPEEDVIVERMQDGRFEVSLLRHHGTTSATVIYTRKQIEMLQRRIGGALEVG